MFMHRNDSLWQWFPHAFYSWAEKRHILLKLAIKNLHYGKGDNQLSYWEGIQASCWEAVNDLLWVEMSDDTVFFLYIINFVPSWSMINSIRPSCHNSPGVHLLSKVSFFWGHLWLSGFVFLKYVSGMMAMEGGLAAFICQQNGFMLRF